MSLLRREGRRVATWEQLELGWRSPRMMRLSVLAAQVSIGAGGCARAGMTSASSSVGVLRLELGQLDLHYRRLLVVNGPLLCCG